MSRVAEPVTPFVIPVQPLLVLSTPVNNDVLGSVAARASHHSSGHNRRLSLSPPSVWSGLGTLETYGGLTLRLTGAVLLSIECGLFLRDAVLHLAYHSSGVPKGIEALRVIIKRNEDNDKETT